MTHRERALKAIRFEGPDRIPIVHTQLTAALLKYGEQLLALYRKYPGDFNSPECFLPLPKPEPRFRRTDGSFYKEETDEWGCVWAYHQEGIAGQVIKYPLADWAGLKDWKMPAPPLATAEARTKAVEFQQQKMAGYPVWLGAGNYFERMHFLRGYENLLCDLAEDSREVYELADRILYEYILPAIENDIATGLMVDIIGFGDDWGTQESLMIRPETWRKVFKPRYKKMFDLCHKHGAHTFMHSDGMTLDIVPDLIEIGLDIFNPQFSCLDLRKLKALADGRLCICTDIDRQQTLSFGTPADVRTYVKMVHDIFQPERGGLIWRGEIGPDVSLENAEAMFRAFSEFQ